MQTSIFLPLILMASTGDSGVETSSILSRADAQISTSVSTTVSSPANIMPNSHFRSQSGFQNDIQNAAQSGVRAGSQSGGQDSIAANAVPEGIFEGCRPAVLDPRLSSRILFDNRLAVLEDEYGVSEATSKDQIFIARCGDEFVLFSRISAGQGQAQDALYLRFQEGSFQLVDQHWG